MHAARMGCAPSVILMLLRAHTQVRPYKFLRGASRPAHPRRRLKPPPAPKPSPLKRTKPQGVGKADLLVPKPGISIPGDPYRVLRDPDRVLRDPDRVLRDPDRVLRDPLRHK